MTDRLTEIKARLAKAINVSELCTRPAFDGKKVWFNEHYSREFSSTHHADLIAHCPDDIAWLIAELEKERAENARLLNINHGLQMQLDDHLGEQPKVCEDCIKNYHTICQWEIEYAPGCVCGCHLTRNLTG